MAEKESVFWRKHIPAYGESSLNAREIIIISYISGNEGAGGGIFEGYKPFFEPTKPLRTVDLQSLDLKSTTSGRSWPYL